MKPSKIKIKLMERIRAGAAVLTVNKRLSRTIMSSFEDFMMSEGECAWSTPMVMPFEAWKLHLWKELSDVEPVITPERAALLWKGIVLKELIDAQEGSIANILLVEGGALDAYKGYELMSEYGFSFDGEDIYLTEEALALQRWRGQYLNELKRLGFIDSPRLGRKLAAMIASMDDESKECIDKLPKEIILAGFDELLPTTVLLMEALRQKGVEVDFYPAPLSIVKLADKKSSSPSGVLDKLLGFTDVQTEVIQAARWVREVYKPGIRIGIIVPELDAYRAMIEREFRAELTPGAVLISGVSAEIEGVFNISLGTSLMEEPLVRAAIEVLALSVELKEHGRVSVKRLFKLLDTPFLISREERFSLASFIAKSNELRCLDARITLIDIIGFLEKEAALSNLRGRLSAWKAAIDNLPNKAKPSSLVECFDKILTRLGCSQLRSELTSREVQTLSAWREILRASATLDIVVGDIVKGELTPHEMTEHVRALAREKLHQVETPESEVQILGLLEAAGQEFDLIRILGAHDGAFPTSPSPNPFIPIYLLKRHKVSKTTPEECLAFAQTVLKRLLASAESVEASYPKLLEGNREVKASPLFLAVAEVHHERAVLIEKSSALADREVTEGELEAMPKDKDIEVSAEEWEGIHGGTAIIKDQSACPFRAFAVRRLGAKERITPEFGFDNLERGSLLHVALKNFWGEVRDSKELHRLKECLELTERISQAVSEALKKFSNNEKKPSAMLKLEEKRLSLLLLNSIEIDLKRGSFTVKEREKECEIKLKAMTLHAFIDRIDELENGEKIVIDYKSGDCSVEDWLGPRPKEPQLPLYNIYDDFYATAFSTIRIKGTRYTGLSRDDCDISGVSSIDKNRWTARIDGIESFADFKKMWRETLEALADEFMRGEARVNPTEYKQGSACDYCEVRPFCRIFTADSAPSRGFKR
jgi:probable DNA repair protein